MWGAGGHNGTAKIPARHLLLSVRVSVYLQVLCPEMQHKIPTFHCHLFCTPVWHAVGSIHRGNARCCSCSTAEASLEMKRIRRVCQSQKMLTECVSGEASSTLDKKREPPPKSLPSGQKHSSIWASIALLSAFCFLSQSQSFKAPPFLAREQLAAPRPLLIAS